MTKKRTIDIEKAYDFLANNNELSAEEKNFIMDVFEGRVKVSLQSVSGQTYENRDFLKKNGLHWEPSTKSWVGSRIEGCATLIGLLDRVYSQLNEKE